MSVIILASAAWASPWSVGEAAVEGESRGKGDILGLGPGYMRSLSNLPLLETLYEARVGLYAGAIILYKGKRILI